ncbi:MRN complex-interacting protein isoform X4 [Mobula hypostoma]|uniref:MRN complex-interacting protein isoform X4 n=1 Tax=Mobula hypostoma TaxID=723540 RepID=UPI002FC332F6
MAQRFQALRCCFCQTYQVQQVKKSKKWNCKLCGEKQSVLKVYGQGSGSDCRQHVQKLNMLRGMKMQAMEATTWSTEEPRYSSDDCRPQKYCVENEPNQATSRWCVYLDQKHVEEPVEQEGGDDKIVYTDRQQFQTDMKNAISNRSQTINPHWSRKVDSTSGKHLKGLVFMKMPRIIGNASHSGRKWKEI